MALLGPPLLAVGRLGHAALLARPPPGRRGARSAESGDSACWACCGFGFGPARWSLRIALASSGFWRSIAAWLTFWNCRRSHGIFEQRER